MALNHVMTATLNSNIISDQNYSNITDRFLSTLETASTTRGSNYRSLDNNTQSRTQFPYFPRPLSSTGSHSTSISGTSQSSRPRRNGRSFVRRTSLFGSRDGDTTNLSRDNSNFESTTVSNSRVNTNQVDYTSDIRAFGNRSSPFVLRQDNFMMFRSNNPFSYHHPMSNPSDTNDSSPMSSNQEEEETTTNITASDYGSPEFSRSGSDIPESKLHNATIAEALGFTTRQRLLKFKPLKKKRAAITSDTNMIQLGESSVVNNRQLGSPTRTLNKSFNNNFSSSKVRTDIPSRVLEAPCLRDDYYSNLVDWSKVSHKLVVGLAGGAYFWDQVNGTVPLETIDDEIVSCVSLSLSDVLVVGTKSGRLMVYDQGSLSISVTGILKPDCGVECICWIPDSLMFFAGDDSGDVTLYEILKQTIPEVNVEDPTAPVSFTNNLILKIKGTLKCNSSQVCGIDINPDKTQIAVGGNNNLCTLWDITNLARPRLTHNLKHNAAVKAIAYCPWMPSLLATGAGSKDRNVRFWHSKSGTLIDTFKTSGQLTSLIWSRTKREILATYGFGETTGTTTLIAVYSYPKMETKVRIDMPSGIRILSASLSYDNTSICTAVSDQSVRLFKIWRTCTRNLQLDCGGGTFGSNIIELEEGIDSSFEMLR